MKSISFYSIVAITLLLNLLVSLNVKAGEKTMINVFENIPYKEEGLGNRKLVDEKYALVMQVALKPGQSVPQHNANSNVHILVLKGTVTLTCNQDEKVISEGDLVPAAFKTAMSIKNTGKEDATFLVLKTPNPSEMK